ncbi:MAG: methyltransferase [Chitinophagaceae bacterium]
MSNAYFDFKQFRIVQDACAMKVSTDACIQGAWTPVAEQVRSVLDIGAGTGLLAMMIAQRSTECVCDAIEINPQAAAQATENVNSSQFAPRINVHCADAEQWIPDRKYDLIICNPPFFEKSLKSDDTARMQARHTDSLSYEALSSLIAQALNKGGYASILLPASQEQSWLDACAHSGLSVFQRLLIRPFAGRDPNRIIFIMGTDLKNSADEELIIYEKPGVYTETFKELMHPFYLHL